MKDQKVRYIIELPNFNFPKKELFEYQNNHQDYKENIWFQQMRNLNTAKTCKFFDLTNVDNPVVKQVFVDAGTDDGKFTKVLAGGVMPMHIDPQRTAVLMLPLTDNPSPIVFYEDYQEVFKHVYTGPTIINAKIKHGVPKVARDRIFLQINFFNPWNEICEQFSKKEIIDI